MRERCDDVCRLVVLGILRRNRRGGHRVPNRGLEALVGSGARQLRQRNDSEREAQHEHAARVRVAAAPEAPLELERHLAEHRDVRDRTQHAGLHEAAEHEHHERVHGAAPTIFVGRARGFDDAVEGLLARSRVVLQSGEFCAVDQVRDGGFEVGAVHGGCCGVGGRAGVHDAPWGLGPTKVSPFLGFRQHAFLVKIAKIRHNLAIYGFLPFHDFR